MDGEALLGLIDCPFAKGWIEFSYARGDTIAGLVEQVNAQWGGTLRACSSGLARIPNSLVLFCAQANGKYVAMRRSDPIPIHPVHDAVSGENGLRFYGDDGVVDLAWGQESWVIRNNQPFEPKEHIETDLPIRRAYATPDKAYSARLVALVAIVGG